MHTRAVAMREGSPSAGKTLEELALRRQHGITVLAVRRGGKAIASPAGDFQVQVGDRLILISTAERFAACAALFSSRDPYYRPIVWKAIVRISFARSS